MNTKKTRSQTSPNDLHKYVYRCPWPIFQYPPPSLIQDTSPNMTQSLLTRVSDGMFKSITRHCESLNVDKSGWIREAIRRQLAEEQIHFLNGIRART